MGAYLPAWVHAAGGGFYQGQPITEAFAMQPAIAIL
jgi:hypothetical protein